MFNVIKCPIITKQEETYFISIVVLKSLTIHQTNLLETIIIVAPNTHTNTKI